METELFQKDNEEKTRSSRSASGTGRGEKAGSGVIRKQRPTNVSLGGLRTRGREGSDRERLVGFQKGTDQWLSGQQWPPANRPTVPSSSRTYTPRGSDSQPNPYEFAPVGSSVRGNSSECPGQLGRLATGTQGN